MANAMTKTYIVKAYKETEHCTAIFDCWPPQIFPGIEIKRAFDQIRLDPAHCEICGEYYFVSMNVDSMLYRDAK